MQILNRSTLSPESGISVRKSKQMHHFFYHWKCKCRMNSGSHKRQEEYCHYLRIDRLTHFFLCHPHFHQNLESVLILIAFCNLFIINDQHHSKNEYDSKKDSKEEQTAVQSLVISLDAALLSVEAPKNRVSDSSDSCSANALIFLSISF